MTYQQTVNYLYEQLPMFTRIGAAAFKKDLTNTIRLCGMLGNPQDKFKSIHVAGTNGKGSVTHMLAAVFQEAGYKTGLYTSPHLIDFRERIRIDGLPVSKQWVIDFVERYKQQIEEIEPSFFEITVAMAFAAFAEQEVDIAIIETGMGGRLDSTNVVTPLVSVITNIGFDHMEFLGQTLPEIATEKAGIIKQGVPVVIGEQHPETEGVFFENSVHKQSVVYHAESMWDMVRTKNDLQYQVFKAIHRGRREMHDITTDLLGDYQAANIKTVLAVRDVLVSSGMAELPLDVTFAALSKVKKLTGLRGRWDVLQQEPLIIADVAHNPAGLTGAMKQWNNITAGKKHIVTGFVKDKDVAAALALYPKDNIYYFCNADIPRAMPASQLQSAAKVAGLEGNMYVSVADAVKAAREALAKNDALLITGSVFVVGEAIQYLNVNNGKLFPTSLV
ncbi:MAG: bifunctional folylpolyglutamate synthase/dihydrofolate synthase [Chitinophagaceae bacterium]|nr:bifunctional folylpolyglutamate synthase/dihydrofolate synthase [Chitinophagaceae bacterium]MCB9047476.1 bifunctional folylpolyglutamate synthase/dihydrofolate synthase [Chitinophagales bacterium]